MATIETTPLTDQEAWKLLPWLVTDRLEERELHRLLDHLKESPASRRELRYLSDLGHLLELGQEGSSQPDLDPEPALAELMARIDDSEQLAAEGTPWHQRLAALLGLHRRQAFAVLAQAAIVACLTLAAAWQWPWWSQWRQQSLAEPSRPAQFHTLSSPETQPATGPRLTLVFLPRAQEQDIRRLLRAAKAEIVAGPTSRGAYTVALDGADGAGPETILTELRRDPAVALAELAAGSQPSSP